MSENLFCDISETFAGNDKAGVEEDDEDAKSQSYEGEDFGSELSGGEAIMGVLEGLGMFILGGGRLVRLVLFVVVGMVVCFCAAGGSM